jgi:hypothetical protein
MSLLHVRTLAPTLLCLLTLAVAGCAGSKLPPPDFSGPRSTIAEADQAGASESAPLLLRNARQKLQQAETAAADGDMERAQFLADEAAVDAELAAATARAANAQTAVDELRESVRVLREEIERNRRTGQ